MATTMLQVKLGVLILVVAVVVSTGNGLCSYSVTFQTTFGTKSNVILGMYDKDGAGWKEKALARKFHTGDYGTYTAVDKACMDPCRLTLQLEKAGGDWFPLAVDIKVKEDQVVKYRWTFPVLQVVTEGGLVEVNKCKKQLSSSPY